MKINSINRRILLALIIVCLVVAAFLMSIRIRGHQVWAFQQEITEDLCFTTDPESDFVIYPSWVDGSYRVVFPAFWPLDSIYLRYTGKETSNLQIGNQYYSSEWRKIKIDSLLSCDAQWKILPDYSFQIVIYRSKVNAIFINTESKTFQEIDDSQDKSVKDSGELLAVTSSGEIHYKGRLDNIHGRGNMTWNMAKKPYSIKLEDKAEIFGLKKAKKFNLLADACDESALRNWIMLNTAEELHLPNAIHSAFTILYRNGKYNGLYMITNKVEIGKSGIKINDLEEETQELNDKKLDKYKHFSIDRNDTIGFLKGYEIKNNPEDISGGYLIEQNFKLNRYTEGPSGFIPRYGYPSEIKAPEHASREQVEYISRYLDETMEAIRSRNGIHPVTHKHYSDYIDVDSFIFYYLFSETFYNLDAVNASLLMYKDRGAKLFCGPMWDYDLCLNTKVYFEKANGFNSLFVREAQEADGSLRIFGQLYQHPEFKRRLIQLYNEQFLPAVRLYYQNGVLDSIHDALAQDIEQNGIWWNSLTDYINNVFFNRMKLNETAYAERYEIDKNGDFWNVKNFLSKRCEYLANVWSTENSEQSYQTIIWDFGRVEQFQHVPTRVAYLAKGETWTWPRYMISDAKDTLINVTDANGKPLKGNEVSPFINLIYKQK